MEGSLMNWVGILLGAGGFILALIAQLLNNKRQRDLDAAAERLDVQDKALGVLQRQFDGLGRKHDRLHEEHVECKTENAVLRNEIRNLQNRLNRYILGGPEQLSHATVIANSDGIITDISPGVTYMLHWKREDLIGQPVTKMMAPEYIKRHKAAFEKRIEGGGFPTEGPPVIGEALSMEGNRVHVEVQPSAWVDTETGKWMYGADITKIPKPAI